MERHHPLVCDRTSERESFLDEGNSIVERYYCLFPFPLDYPLFPRYSSTMTTLTKTNNTLTKVGHKHEAIMQWLLENPESKLGDCAAHFGMTQTWLSIVIHSAAFQDAFAKYREDYYGEAAAGLDEKLNGLIHLAVDKLSEKMETCDDTQWIANTTDKLLGRLGYGTGGGSKINVIANGDGAVTIQTVSGEALIRADATRKRLQAIKQIEGETLRGDETA